MWIGRSRDNYLFAVPDLSPSQRRALAKHGRAVRRGARSRGTDPWDETSEYLTADREARIREAIAGRSDMRNKAVPPEVLDAYLKVDGSLPPTERMRDVPLEWQLDIRALVLTELLPT